jgi:hypothetical protein
MTDVQSAVGRLLGGGMSEAQLVRLLEGFAEAIEDGARQWELDLHDLNPLTAFALGGFTAQVIREAEKRGYTNGLAEGYKDVDRLGEAIAGAKVVREAATAAGLIDTGAEPERDQPPAYLLWDNERGMWWKPNGQGYTFSVAQAGLYSRDEAVKWALQGALGGLGHATVIVADGAA